MIGENVAAWSSGFDRRHVRLSSGPRSLPPVYPSRRGEESTAERSCRPQLVGVIETRLSTALCVAAACDASTPSDCIAIERRFRLSSRELYWCARK